MITTMARSEFNLSVLENTTNFSTPLKDCSQYEAILSLIKEEIDIAHTEDEAEYHKCGKKMEMATKRKDSESNDSEGVFKSPYKKNYARKSKSPGNNLMPRTLRRSLENMKTRVKSYAPQRARSLGRIMPGRSRQSTDRKHRSSISHSETSDSVENEKITNLENGTTRNIFTKKVKKENETAEGKALEDLLMTAREQVIVKGQPSDGNSTVSSQGDSSSLATTDPLAIESVEEDYVESSQNDQISDIRLKLLAQRNSASTKPKTAEMIKKNLHFDATESDDDNQHFSLTLSPDPKTLINSNQGSNSTSPHQKNGKESPDSGLSAASTLKNVSQNLRNLDTKIKTNVETLRLTKRKTSEDSDTSTLKDFQQNLENLTPNSCDSHHQKESNESPKHSSEMKGIEDNAFSPQKNLTKIRQNCCLEKEENSILPPFDDKKMGQNNIESTLENPPLILANTQHQGESNKVEKTPPVDADENSIKNVDRKSGSSATPLRQKRRKKKDLKTASSQESLTEESSNLDVEMKEILTPSRPRKRKPSRESEENFQTNLTEDFGPRKEGSTTPPYPRKRKPNRMKAASSQESLIEDSSHSDFGKKEIPTSPSPRKNNTSQEDAAIIQTDLQQHLEPKEEADATPIRPKKRKPKTINTASFQENLTEESNNLKSEKEGSLTPPHPRKRKKKEIIINDSVKETNGNSPLLDSKTKVNTPSVQSRKNKKSKAILSDSPLKITDLDSKNRTSASSALPMTNIPKGAIIPTSPKDSVVLSPKKEPSASPLGPKKKKYIQEVISDLLQNATDLDFHTKTNTKRSHSRKKKVIREALSNPIQESNELSPKKEASLTPPCQKKKKKTDNEHQQEIESDPLKDSADLTCNKDNSTKVSRSKKKKTNDLIASTPAVDSTDLSPKKEANLTPPRPQKLNSSIASPLKGLTQEFEECIMNNDFDQMCKDIDNNLETPSFTFETVQLLDEYDSRNQHANNILLSKILSSPNSKTGEEPPLGIEHIGSSEDLLDYDPLYIAKVDEKRPATASTSKRKRSVVKAKKNDDKKKSNNADTVENRGRRASIRLKGKRLTMDKSDIEDCGDLSDEAAKLAEKVEAAKKKENLPPDTLIKLDEIVVQLRHKVLPQHEIEQRAGTAPLTYGQQLEFLEYASLNKDTYSDEEDAIIKRNWKAFCEDHDWDPKDYKPFLHFKHGDHLIMSSIEERRKFVQFLADGLPNRPLFSVYSRFKILYSNYPDAGLRYSAEEDKKILAYMLHNTEKEPSAKCSALSKVLKRSRVSIWRRYQNLIAKENRNKDKKKEVLMKVTWELPLVNDFIDKLLDVSVSDDLAELKDAFIPKVVWEKLQKKIGIHYEFLRRSWDQQFHLQFFSPEPLSLNATKIRLIEYMWMKGIRNSKEIEWHIVVKYFDGCTIPFLRRMFNHLTAHASTVVRSRSLHEILKWLHTKKIEQLRHDPKDKLLPRLCYVDKKVEIVPEDFMILTMTSDNTSD